MLNSLKHLNAWKHMYFKQIDGKMKSYRSLRKSISAIEDPIDFVVTWVDGNDPVWQHEKAKYTPDYKKGNTQARYREWNQFMYWFRSVEKYAPWVRKVFLVTWGHIPPYLNTTNERLVIVNHKDFIPEEYLPTFSSIPIELNLHRIPGLSEHFVYFKDDVYLSSPVSSGDFFQNGLPKYCSIAYPLRNYRYNGPFVHQKLSVIGLINGSFDVYSTIDRHPELWFSHVYGKDVIYNQRAYKESYLQGMFFSHVACPFRKSTFEKVWEFFSEELRETCTHRFRTPMDVFHQIFTLWEIMEGTFVPVGPRHYGQAFGSLSTQIPEIQRAFASKTYKMVCVNDSIDVNDDNFGRIRAELDCILQATFPEKSSFER